MKHTAVSGVGAGSKGRVVNLKDGLLLMSLLPSHHFPDGFDVRLDDAGGGLGVPRKTT